MNKLMLIFRRTFPFTLIFLFFFGLKISAQQTYLDTISTFRQNYILTHDVVKKEDRQYFRFYPLSAAWRIRCRFEHVENGAWFQMATSGKEKQTFRKFGKITFTIHDTVVHLFVYQSQSLMKTKDYAEYLFIPFTDATSGLETYGAGRYLECFINDIKVNTLFLDFNKAYNPSCAYAVGYNCPVPPRENDLPVAIRAGEMNYAKKIH